jgi:hypothetical protein
LQVFLFPCGELSLAIDRLFAIPIEVAGDALEKKLKGNLDEHVENVQKARRRKGKKDNLDNPSVKTTRAIADWARRAAEIDVEEVEPSSLWEALLDAIMDDEVRGERLLAIVRNAQPDDIRLVLARYAGAPGRVSVNPGQWGRLEDLGLVGRLLPAAGLAFLCMGTALLLYIINDFAPLRVIGAPALSTTASIFRMIGDLGIPIGGCFVIFLIAFYFTHIPTGAGHDLIDGP